MLRHHSQIVNCGTTNQLQNKLYPTRSREVRSLGTRRAATYFSRDTRDARDQKSYAQSQQAAVEMTVVDDFATDQRPVILYDGVCNMCNGAVNVMLDWDKTGVCRLAALQSPAGRRLLQRSGRHPDDISSIVLVEPNASYIRSEAVLRIAQKLSIPVALIAWMAWLVPTFVRDPVYDLVANNRYSFLGKRDTCRLMDETHASRFVVD